MTLTEATAQRILELLSDGSPEATAECIRLKAIDRAAWTRATAFLDATQWNTARAITLLTDEPKHAPLLEKR